MYDDSQLSVVFDGMSLVTNISKAGFGVSLMRCDVINVTG